MRNLKRIILVFVCSLCALHSYSSDLFDQGLKSANDKKINQAINLFNQVIQQEQNNVSAYYNLGNCYYQNKSYGEAIWAYERVLKLSPSDSEAPANIELCYKKLNDTSIWAPHINGLQRLIYSFGPTTWAILSILISILMGISIFLLFKMKNNSWKRFHFMLLFGETVFLLAFLVATNTSSTYLTSERFAIVTQKTIPTYMNDLGEKAQLELKEGTKVELLTFTKSKREVMLQNGQKVLIEEKDLRGI
jgi:tetratricopeptide (TPR) repeat protein